MRLLVSLLVVLVLVGCGGGGAGFTYNPIPGVSQEVNDLGRMIGQEQRNVVTPGGDQWRPGFSDDDRAAFENSDRLSRIVNKVKGSQTFQKGVAAIRTLSADTQAIVFAAYSKPIDPTWAETGQIGNGTTEAGQAVERQIAIALTNAVKAAL